MRSLTETEKTGTEIFNKKLIQCMKIVGTVNGYLLEDENGHKHILPFELLDNWEVIEP